MERDESLFRLTRRRCAFWLGMGLFGLAERLHAAPLDDLAAALMRRTDSARAGRTATSTELTLADPTETAAVAQSTTTASPVEHWVATGNRSWRWYERETLTDGRWKVTGITTPVHRATGERYTGHVGYLDDNLVPAELRSSDGMGKLHVVKKEPLDTSTDDDSEQSHGKPDLRRRARHGRPPSKWLRSLNADELRVWLKTIDPPEAGVSGMTFFEHLTRDHSFEATRITGLTIDEQAKLHAAAHYGY